MATNKLQSGNYYSLNELLSNNHKIIIPDLQRDYCWGNKIHGEKDKTELVTGFLDSLLESFNEKKEEDLTLGMIYAYENPTKHIHLCDGQQRITTLFLLLGMLNKEMSNLIQHKLISEQEMQDDYEPYLRYAVRENTLFFMMDLVKEYFLKNDSSTKTPSEYIKKQDWYHEEHNLDASVQSMLSALDIIQEYKGFKDIDKGLFSLFLLEKVKILYYDMENRTHGEEMFVIINTTGEPLTASENIKPILLSQIKDTTTTEQEVQQKYNDEWEDREEFFWHNRKNGEPTADAGVNEFLTWFLQIELQQDAVSITREYFKKVGIPPELNTNFNEHWYCDLLDKIERYFLVLKYLIDNIELIKNGKEFHIIDFKSLTSGKKIGNNEKVALYPVLIYLVNTASFEWKNNQYQINQTKINNAELYRIIRFFSNVSKNTQAVQESIALAKGIKESVLDLLKPTNEYKNTLTEEEIYKLKLYKNPPPNIKREELEHIFWKAEDHKYLHGKIECLLENSKTSDVLDISKFKDLWENYHNIINLGVDLIIRFILTEGDFAVYDTTGTNGNLIGDKYYFPYDYPDWRTFFTNKSEKGYKIFFDALSKISGDIKDSNYKEYIETFLKNFDADKITDWRKFLIKNEEILKYSKQKYFLFEWHNEKSIYVMTSSKLTTGSYKKLEKEFN